MEKYIQLIAAETGLKNSQVENTVNLLNKGATVPFISRYRKELTGSLDEVIIAMIRDRVHQLEELDKRRETILNSINEQGKLTPELQSAILRALTASELEDIYLPYRPKRKTRATIAIAKGLEPLAKEIFAQKNIIVEEAARKYTKTGIDAEEALSGARDIIAEWINEDTQARLLLRKLNENKSVITCKVVKGKEEEGQKYQDWFDYKQSMAKVHSHRILAMFRGENEGFLRLNISPDIQQAQSMLEQLFVKGENPASQQVRMAVEDAYKRLLAPSMENEMRQVLKKKADLEAINVFADNLRQLLLAPPLGQKNILALDPGLRTGCKVVCLDKQGNLLHHDTIFPHPPHRKWDESAAKIQSLVKKYQTEAIAIGNGTAGRETEAFIKSIKFDQAIDTLLISESGASVYSASEVARDEFPEYDVTVRGAVSIGRRLADPLAELVKIDPKSIGVGQYQHDVDQKLLKSSLDDVVMSSVNAVGVEVNTASKELLSYVSGLGPVLADNIVKFRKENGPYQSREALKKIPRFGPKAFEQAAGFLRISQSINPLDRSAVHPESYHIVAKMAKDIGVSVSELINNKPAIEKIIPDKYVTPTVGLPTIMDILSELARPGRDPRNEVTKFEFDPNINSVSDLKQGMKLPGVVTNITAFGTFVDIGVHQDGLIHISQLADRFISNPSEIVKLNQKVMVTVLDVDITRRRVQLSLKF